MPDPDCVLPYLICCGSSLSKQPYLKSVSGAALLYILTCITRHLLLADVSLMHHAGDAVGLSKVFEQLEILKQQQSTEQQLLEILKEQQQQLQSGQQQQQVFEQLEILKQQLQSGQQQQLTEQQLLLQLLTEQQQNYQGLILDLFHPTSSIASSKELKRYRDGAFVFYYGSSSFAAYTCMVTGMECSARELVAGHIYRQQWPKSLLVSKCLPTNMGQRSWRSSKAQTRVG